MVGLGMAFALIYWLLVAAIEWAYLKVKTVIKKRQFEKWAQERGCGPVDWENHNYQTSFKLFYNLQE